MDFLENFFNFENIVLGIVCIIGIVAFVASLRVMRTGGQSYGERHDAMEARIKETRHEMHEKNNSMPAFEQLHIVAHALKDALAQKNHDTGLIIEYADYISLNLAQGSFSVHFLTKNTILHSTKKIMHGQGRWEVRKDGIPVQDFVKLVQLERYLLALLRENGF